jgi:hypothetical protein
MPTMTVAEAQDLAARILAAIDEQTEWHAPQYKAGDRERVAADVRGLQACWEWHEGEGQYNGYLEIFAPFFEAGLRRTAALYGIA